MRARYLGLVDHSIGCALSAIEIYNKPDFKEREQIFAILLVAAWEALLKAKILKTNRNRLNSLYIKSGARYKKNRNGDYLTINVLVAARVSGLPAVALENLERLVEVRDAATHLTAESPTLPMLVYTLGIASLRNYAKLAADWFGMRFEDYSFFILPVGFAYPFQAVTPAELKREPKEVAGILRRISRTQDVAGDEDGGFHLVFEVRTKLVSAKKLTGPVDIVASVDPASERAVVVERKVRLIDQYPLRFTDLWDAIKDQVPEIKQGQVHQLLRELEVRGNADYSAYNYRSKSEEARGPGPGTPVIYNANAERFLVAELRRRYGNYGGRA